MKRFSEVIAEAAKPKSQVLLFGRMNPPTRGHEENVMSAHALAQKNGAGLSIIGSHSHDAKKNPLTPVQKLTHLKRAFGHLKNTTISTSTPEQPTILHQASLLHKQGIRNLTVVGGGDRASGHLKLLQQYNGVKGPHGYYKFDNIAGANTGERKAGISGTAMRNHAQSGNYDAFRKNLPSHIASNEKHAQELYNHVRSGLAKNETIDRETYMQGALSLGEQVEDPQTGLQGRIVYRGPTYVTIQIDESLTLKRWIADVDQLSPIKEDNMNNFKNFIMQEAKKEPELSPDISERDLAAIEDHIKVMHDDEFIELTEDLELDEANLTAAQRMKKKMEFMKTKAKRKIARQISMKKVASQGRLKQRAIKGARMLIMKRLLRGRNKAQLSATEKSRIENIISSAKQAVTRISNKLMPKLRELERKRLKHMHEALGTQPIDKPMLNPISQNATPDDEPLNAADLSDGHKQANRIRTHLAGIKNPDAPEQGSDIDPRNTVQRMKHFRKLEV
jgi:nicotinamide mononucleotide adenylyltransferase